MGGNQYGAQITRSVSAVAAKQRERGKAGEREWGERKERTKEGRESGVRERTERRREERVG